MTLSSEPYDGTYSTGQKILTIQRFLAMVKIEVTESTKKIFGLKTVALAFEYGVVVGVAAGSVGGFLLGKAYFSDDLSMVQKSKKIGTLAIYSLGGAVVFGGIVHAITLIKIKG